MKGVFNKIYFVVSKIPKGKVLTYGHVALILEKEFGVWISPRLVGFALHWNNQKEVPCHRVVFADGSLSRSFVFGGVKAQKHKLKSEGVFFTKDDRVNLGICLLRDWKF